MILIPRRRVIWIIPTLSLCWLGTLAFAAGLTVLAGIFARFPGDLLIAGWIQSVHLPGLSAVSESLDQLGAPLILAFVGCVVGAVFFRAGHRLAASFLILAVVARALDVVLKGVSERPRPAAELVEILQQSSGFSFPSGHVLGSVLLWGFVIYLAHRHIPQSKLRRGVQALSVAILVLTGLQRIYAGVHWPSDVAGGYLWGALLLVVIIWAHELLRGRVDRSAAPADFEYQS